MIVEPDFVDHWKTRLVVGALDGDEMAPIYIMRLWSHCQDRRDDKFASLPAVGIKAICRCHHDADKLEAALILGEYFKRNADGSAEVLKFRKYNATLFANWENGKKGGRPPKDGDDKPNGNPAVNPTGTHGLTQQEPNPEIGVTDKKEKKKENEIREDSSSKESPNGDSVGGADDPAPEGLPDLTSEVFSSWNRTEGTKKARDLHGNRLKHLRIRLRDPTWDWRAALGRFPLRLCMSDPTGWQPTFDWFVKPDSVTKILEGKYDWDKNDGKRKQIANAGATYDANRPGELSF
jgi:hypothetical protein